MNPDSRPSRTRVTVVAVCWLALFVVALFTDRMVADYFYWHAADKHHIGNVILKMPGEFAFALAVAVALWTWHPSGWRAAGHVALSAVLGGLIYAVAKWVVGRQRPVTGVDAFELDLFRHGWGGFLTAENMSFPSGHVTMAFAIAGCLAINVPRWKYLWFAAASLCCVERVAENAHYVSDVVAGAGVGTLSAYLVYWAERALAARAQRSAEGSLPLGATTSGA